MHAALAFLFATLACNALATPLAKRAPVGQVLLQCTTPNTIALTFDDGPSQYTPQLLDILSQYGARATFFVLGDAAASNPGILTRIRNEGHQVASHTYTHPSLASLGDAGIRSEMTQLDNVIRPALGVVPSYMRPPYLETSPAMLQTMANMNYRVISASIDTKDYENQDANAIINVAYANFVNQLDGGGSIVLAHDIHYWTVASLAERMLQEVNRRGIVATTVGDCLGEAEGIWYR
ncbi:chitin deacetylase [Aspergillus stella-maris]|uniref:chitin deacetylase n=1 Tax=Aspergillus stella-maris TaxID=1810926 RepID=UPI003CCD2321